MVDATQLPIDETTAPIQDRPVLIGLCERSLIRIDGLVQDFFGVSRIAFISVYPTTLRGVGLLLAFPASLLKPDENMRVVFRDQGDARQSAWVDVALGKGEGHKEKFDATRVEHAFTMSQSSGEEQRYACPQYMIAHGEQWHVLVLPAPEFGLSEPKNLDVIFVRNGQECLLGTIQCVFAKPLPLSESERLALKARGGANTVIVELGCKKCTSKLRVFTSLDGRRDRHDGVHIDDAPDVWNCGCGSTNQTLHYLKLGIHDFLRRGSAGRIGKDFFPLYQAGAIDAILRDYEALIRRATNEAEVQQFLEDNPIIWHFLAPARIWNKPPVLAHFKADFAILSSTGILYLIEIEKPTTRLAKLGGGLHSDLQHGFDQLRDWKHKMLSHRLAILDWFEIEKDVDVRYVLIAGLAYKTESTELQKLRSDHPPADMFFCFDELASMLNVTRSSLRSL